ncbi:hypothetical protein RRG08_049992 [Elysia crispata]|uniref:Uncharacterized protein n=1 Tax=Elysia crispata TaxID=231223 RepID=A0AAE1B9L6_9GAST|nr:hypothetical protein RRG08_049992 [Elysia crispata]
MAPVDEAVLIRARHKDCLPLYFSASLSSKSEMSSTSIVMQVLNRYGNTTRRRLMSEDRPRSHTKPALNHYKAAFTEKS